MKADLYKVQFLTLQRIEFGAILPPVSSRSPGLEQPMIFVFLDLFRLPSNNLFINQVAIISSILFFSPIYSNNEKVLLCLFCSIRKCFQPFLFLYWSLKAAQNKKKIFVGVWFIFTPDFKKASHSYKRTK